MLYSAAEVEGVAVAVVGGEAALAALVVPLGAVLVAVAASPEVAVERRSARSALLNGRN